MEKISLKCQACGGVLEADKDCKIMYCPYCGVAEMLEESDAVKIAIDNNKTELEKDNNQKELELRKLELLSQKQEQRHDALIAIACLGFMLLLILVCGFMYFNS